MNIGERARQLRDGKGVTRDRLSEISGLSAGTVSNIESDRDPQISSVQKYAKGLGITVSDLIGEPTGADNVLPGWSSLAPEQQQAVKDMVHAYASSAQAETLIRWILDEYPEFAERLRELRERARPSQDD